MFNRAFVFPGLKHLGYESGFSVAMTPELRSYDDLCLEIIWFRDGRRQSIKKLIVPPANAMSLRSFESEWGFESEEHNATDLYCLRIYSPSHPEVHLPTTGLEGLMIFRHRTHGWLSSVLTGFIPARASGYKFAPIIHTAHCMADAKNTETVNLFINLHDIDNPEIQSGGTLTAEVYTLHGQLLGKAHYPILANASVAVSHDTLMHDCKLPISTLEQGINVKYHGGASQFAILTMFRHRTNGGIGLEHSLAPLYYMPDLKNPEVRKLVYSQLEAA